MQEIVIKHLLYDRTIIGAMNKSREVTPQGADILKERKQIILT